MAVSKERELNYVLITKSGQIMEFYFKSVAEIYQQILGGNIITKQEVNFAHSDK